ncbi:MAG: FABP family protein [Devosiaceae bacterium]|nr:FABP family protein [Devosiaceae bacterium]
MINSTGICRSALRYGIVGAIALSGLGISVPAYAAPEDLALIQSYIGDWRGRGTLTAEGQEDETVVCRLSVTKSSAEKINYRGRCTLAGANLSMNGTMAFISDKNRYEAIMTSNTEFTGVAIGTRQGNNVTFNLQSTAENGMVSRVKAGFGLSDGDIEVSFEVTRDDGSKLVAQIPFDRR